MRTRFVCNPNVCPLVPTEKQRMRLRACLHNSGGAVLAVDNERQRGLLQPWHGAFQEQQHQHGRLVPAPPPFPPPQHLTVEENVDDGAIIVRTRLEPMGMTIASNSESFIEKPPCLFWPLHKDLSWAFQMRPLGLVNATCCKGGTQAGPRAGPPRCDCWAWSSRLRNGESIGRSKGHFFF